MPLDFCGHGSWSMCKEASLLTLGIAKITTLLCAIRLPSRIGCLFIQDNYRGFKPNYKHLWVLTNAYNFIFVLLRILIIIVYFFIVTEQ